MAGKNCRRSNSMESAASCSLASQPGRSSAGVLEPCADRDLLRGPVDAGNIALGAVAAAGCATADSVAIFQQDVFDVGNRWRLDGRLVGILARKAPGGSGDSRPTAP